MGLGSDASFTAMVAPLWLASTVKFARVLPAQPNAQFMNWVLAQAYGVLAATPRARESAYQRSVAVLLMT